ncbi:MAG TPA: ECF-type sigma factor [Phycisphaerae bacterium]|nr:ECF-type sigma factor [Phycisphaerae bacterium]HRW55505.1 ECF-type sigma factor [Phycisphaerae bacterium]
MNAGDVTLLLQGIRLGTPDAVSQLIEAVYGELRVMAELKMRAVRPGHTLLPTALVNEAFLRLVGNSDRLEDRGHFFGAAARAMERVLVDYARQKKALKRGGADAQRVTLHDLHVQAPDSQLGVLEVHEAISTLEREAPDLATIVRFRFFMGMTLEQIADLEGVSLATVKRRWTFARAWLYDHLEG